VAPGVMEACSHHVRMLLPRLRLADQQHDQLLREIDAQLDALSEDEQGKTEHRDARILRSLPGVGTVVCATMLAEAWQPLERRDYRELRALCGVAPVTRRSGKQHTVSMRHACSRRLRDAVHFWAGTAMTRDPKAKALYAAQRSRGHTHGRALRGLADRLLGVLLAMLRTGTVYDPKRRQVPAAPEEALPT
jgi:transposase